MPPLFIRLMAILTTIAFIIAMSAQAAPSAEAMGLAAPAKAAKMAMADEDCPRMAAEHINPDPSKQKPCRGIMLDCVKQMGCIGSPTLPQRTDELLTPVSYNIVFYWTPLDYRTGRSIKPDLGPPIAS